MSKAITLAQLELHALKSANYTDKKVSVLSENVADSLEAAYDDLRNVVAQDVMDQLKGLPVFGVVDASNKIKLTTLLPNGTYVMGYEDEDGVFTELAEFEIVNGGEPELPYINQIPLAVKTDDSPYVGDNGEDGYKVGYRINSSGVEGTQDGMCCTGFIPYLDGQKIRLKNITVAGSKTPYIVQYYQNKSYYQVQSLETVLPNDGNGVYTGVLSGFSGWIRITCGVIDDTSILTLDEEIV